METILLAGGFGTRLKSLTKDIPKPMVDINGRPFLDYLIKYLEKNKIKKIIFSVFYKSESIIDYYGSSINGIEIIYSIDKGPLGTGGAILEALKICEEKHVLVINADTYFDVKIESLLGLHLKKQNDITLSLKPMKKFDKYGYVRTNKNGRVVGFEEKKFQENGEIDGGVYIINNNIFQGYKHEETFSFTDYIKNNLNQLKVGSIIFDDFFIDIGTLDDYSIAKNIFKSF